MISRKIANNCINIIAKIWHYSKEAVRRPIIALRIAANSAAQRFAPRYQDFFILGLLCCIYPIVILILPATPLDFSGISSGLMAEALTYSGIIAIAGRLIGVCACILLVCQEHWHYKLRQKYLYCFWYGTLLWCLPLLSIHGILTNPGEPFWGMHAIVAIYLLSAFVDSRSFVVLTVIGALIASAIAGLQHYAYDVGLQTSKPSELALAVAMLSYVPLYLAAAHSRYKNRRQEDKMRFAFGSVLSHELRSPIAQTYSGTDVLINLLSGAKQHGDQAIPLTEADYEMLEYLHDALPSILYKGCKYAESAMMVGDGVALQGDEGVYNIREAVKHILSTYQLPESEAKRIVFEAKADNREESEATFTGSITLLSIAIHCLLRNAFKYAGRKAQIGIWLEGRKLHIMDNGAGISPNALPYIFDLHYNTGGTGLGLTLCKSILLTMGAEISCRSELGKYTEFIISF